MLQLFEGECVPDFERLKLELLKEEVTSHPPLSVIGKYILSGVVIMKKKNNVTKTFWTAVHGNRDPVFMKLGPNRDPRQPKYGPQTAIDQTCHG